MKKYFFVAASAALVMSSCSNEIEQVTELGNKMQEIKVETYTPGMTRAYLADADTLQKYGFWLYAVASDEEKTVKFNHHFQYSGSSWIPCSGYDSEAWVPADDLNVVWPAAEAVKFIAVYNKSLENECPIILSENGDASLVVRQFETDVMVAEKTTSLKDNKSGTVALKFNHILAEVELQVKAAQTGHTYTLYGASIKAPGSYTYNFSDEKSTGDSVVYTVRAQAITDNHIDLTQYGEEYPENKVDELTSSFQTFASSLLYVPGNVTLSLGYRIMLGQEEVALETAKTANVTLVAGKKNIIQVTLNAGDVPMSVSATVADWVDEETNPENVIEPELN